VGENLKADALKEFWGKRTLQSISKIFQMNDVPYAECSESQNSQYILSALQQRDQSQGGEITRSSHRQFRITGTYLKKKTLKGLLYLFTNKYVYFIL